ncbi:MAG TPA: hypothetical protein VHG28_10805 [Longimicrobiaceae bacterium]|nr:hypothetical protein [Longimicrobiaceae bacterium]
MASQAQNNTEEQAICSMYRDGVSLRTLEVAFGRSDTEIIEVLERNGVVEPEAGESREAFVERIRNDVKHQGT